MKKIKIPKLNRQQFVTAIALVIAVYIGISTLGIIARNYRLQQEVDRLKQENELLALQNQELELEITYYRTDAFVDKEARAKLGMQAPGEHVLIFSNKIPGKADLTPDDGGKNLSIAQTAVSNFSQWMYFLFRVEPR